MGEILGMDVGLSAPSFNVTGFFSNTWIYVLIVAILGIILIGVIATMLFYKTYNRRIIIFSQQNWLVPVKKTRGRVIKLREGGVEVMKTLMGDYLSAYGKTMGPKTYWYERGEDGYLRNFVLDKFGNVQYIDGDMRMFHGAVDRYSALTYGKTGFLEKYGVHIILFFFLIALVGGMWLIIGKVGDATTALATTAETNQKVMERVDSILSNPQFFTQGGASGLVPAS